jgi:hypothetical protein
LDLKISRFGVRETFAEPHAWASTTRSRFGPNAFPAIFTPPTVQTSYAVVTMPSNRDAPNGNSQDQQSADHQVYFIKKSSESPLAKCIIQACFIFSQGPTSPKRPHKKRRLSINTLNGNACSTEPSQIFSPLLNSSEKSDCVTLRFDTYQKLWSEQEDRTNVRS